MNVDVDVDISIHKCGNECGYGYGCGCGYGYGYRCGYGYMHTEERGSEGREGREREGREGRAGETEARGAPPDFAWTSYNSIKEIVRRLEAHISNAFPDSKHQRVRSHRELVDLA